jgi:hypothetical protein
MDIMTPDQSAILARAEASGRLAWLILVLKQAKGEQYRLPRKYRVSPDDFRGNGYVERLTKLANREDADA